MACVLVVAATLMALHAAEDCRRFLRTEHDTLASQLRASEAPRMPSKPRGKPSAAEQQALVATQQLASRLNAPWPDVFRALEASASAETALLQLEVNGSTLDLRGTALARSPRAMLAYVDAFDTTPALGKVRLVRHDTADNEPTAPLRFEFNNQQPMVDGSMPAAGAKR
jgi:hypothetical protein